MTVGFQIKKAKVAPHSSELTYDSTKFTDRSRNTTKVIKNSMEREECSSEIARLQEAKPIPDARERDWFRSCLA